MFILTPKQEEAKNVVTSKKFTLLAGGSRSGKTAFLVYTLVCRAIIEECRQVILRFHFNDVKRSVGMDTLPKILSLIGIQYTINHSDWVFYIPNVKGTVSEIWLGGLDDKQRVEKILGNEYSTIYINEASQVSYQAYTTAVTRLAENSGLVNKIFIDCNPPEKSHWLYKLFILGEQPESEQKIAKPELYGYLQMNPTDNPYLPKDYIDGVLETLPDRQKQRFLYGEWLDKREGALFTQEQIGRARATMAPQYLPYAVVAIDPAATSGENSDETGIVVVARDSVGDYYVLRDSSLNGTPSEWATAVDKCYTELNLDSAVYETNQGGDMVEYTIHTVNHQIPCHPVRATRGKALRAEPVAALYEQGKVHHVGYFPELEDQMTEWTPEDNYSPDRLDALVWGITYLMTMPLRSGCQPNHPTASGRNSLQSWNKSPVGRPPSFGGGRWR